MTKILLTGYSGFVGAAIKDALSNAIVLLGRAEAGDYKHYPACFSGEEVYSEALQGIDCVIHCAARVHVMNDSSKNPMELYREINTAGTLNLARQASEAGVKRFIFISSIKVNGEFTRSGEPFVSEVRGPPEDFYGLSKYEAEEGLQELKRITDMEVVIIRPPLVYGPGVKGNFAAMLKIAAMRLPLPLGGLSDNRRSMVSIDNLVDLIITCIENPCAANRTFLVSDGVDMSTAEIIAGLRHSFGRSSMLFSVPQVFFEMGLKVLGMSEVCQRLCSSLQVDISETNAILNWYPPFSVDESFKKTAEYYLASR